LGTPAKKAPSGPFADKPFREALRVAVKRPVDDVAKGKTKLEQVAIQLVEGAISGDVSAAKEIADRLDGKVPQGVTGAGGGPVALAISWLPPSA